MSCQTSPLLGLDLVNRVGHRCTVPDFCGMKWMNEKSCIKIGEVTYPRSFVRMYDQSIIHASCFVTAVSLPPFELLEPRKAKLPVWSREFKTVIKRRR
jgi:hypothetical protein